QRMSATANPRTAAMNLRCRQRFQRAAYLPKRSAAGILFANEARLLWSFWKALVNAALVHLIYILVTPERRCILRFAVQATQTRKPARGAHLRVHALAIAKPNAGCGIGRSLPTLGRDA